ncbi:ribonuclease HI [Methylobacterium soli]|uniref:Ribonuclease H n=1 Tax=Methylobacterium soli TaxID=553447 RepID=A0A6L3SN98_9HYPH|nr:ribonuclease HI [Methylobacterium soli]KAB1068500.1 ribonuclease HI [Methylobacterium soli]GJE46527.1 Ribonuclease HI [Methylobacterium soli]
MTNETTVDTPREITIAFDGACLGNHGPGGYAAILINTRTDREKIVRGRETATTNNKMELSAAIAGLNALSPGAVVNMLGDSQYVIKGFTEWLPGWKAKGWRGANKKPVANVDLWQALEMAVARHLSVSWTWVRRHAGHDLNERVNQIASAEAAMA